MKVAEIYENYYSEIPLHTFKNICKGDPTSRFKENELIKVGRYVKWLTKLYINKNLLLEDIEKASEYLTILYGIRNHIKNIDIFSFDSLTSGKKPLFDFVSKYIKPNNLNNEEELLINKYFIINKEADVLYEDKQWLVVYPKTKEASGFYGANTQWCTRNPNSFNTYNDRGKLFIFIAKNKVVNDIANKNSDKLDKQRRFQYHIQDNMFMNLADNSNLTDEVIELAFNVIQNEIYSYYTQNISFDTFKKILQKKYNEIKFEDGYKVIMAHNEYSFRSSVESYLKRYECDYNKLLENFYDINIESRNKMFQLLTNNQEVLNTKLDSKILTKYLIEYNLKDSKILAKLTSYKHLNFDDIVNIITIKNSSNEEISSILYSFPDYINDYSTQPELNDIYLKLIKKYSYLSDEFLYSSLEEYTYRSSRRAENFLEILNKELPFLRDSLKELLYSNTFTYKIRTSIYELLHFPTLINRAVENDNTHHYLNELLNHKLDIAVEQDDLSCNFKSLLDKYFMSNDSLFVHMLFTYIALLNKTENEKNKIDNIIKTYYAEFFDIFEHMNKFLSITSRNHDMHPFNPSLMQQLHFYDKELYDMFKNRKNSIPNTNKNLDFIDNGDYFFAMM